MYFLLRSLLFQLDEERAHNVALRALHYVPSCCFPKTKTRPITALGLAFSHPVGLAAGLDKNGTYLDALAKIGFSFIELGTVTPKAQQGNPKPRLFRIPQVEGIINRMGFNNEGVDFLVHQLKKARYKGVLGVNIGKNKETSLDRAIEDYLICLEKVYPYASYITINISSPNTANLRQLQQKTYLDDLLAGLHQAQGWLASLWQRHVPLILKVSPDESEETLKVICELTIKHGVEGIIATNTSISRDGIQALALSQEEGGLSGKPIKSRSTQCIRLLKSYVGDTVTLIGVGGISCAQDIQEKLDAGATLVQLYSSLIYHGPSLVPRLVKEWHALYQ